MNQIKICVACKKSFRPYLTDESLKNLWWDEEIIEKQEFFEAEYPVGMISRLGFPTQMLCTICVKNGCVVRQSFGGDFYAIIPDKYKKILKETSKKESPEDPNNYKLGFDNKG